MRGMARVLVIIVLLLVLLFGLLFSLQNSTRVPLDLLVAQLQARPLAVWLLVAFALGGLFGMAVSSLAVIRLRASRFRLRRRLEALEKELSGFKSTPLQSREVLGKSAADAG